MAVQEASLQSSTNMSNSAVTEVYTDKDVITVKVDAGDVTLGEKPGMLERMKYSLFGASPEKTPDEFGSEPRPSEDIDRMSVQLENVSNTSAYSMHSSALPKKMSVLDELDAYWKEHDACSA